MLWYMLNHEMQFVKTILWFDLLPVGMVNIPLEQFLKSSWKENSRTKAAVKESSHSCALLEQQHC